MKLRFLAILVLILASNTFIHAQSETNSTNITSSIESNLEKNADAAFFADDTNSKVYVDFESVGMIISEIILKDQLGAIVFREDVLELPADTLYEIDLSPYKNQNFMVELHSYTAVVTKEVSSKI